MRVLSRGRCGPLLPLLEAMECPACRCALMLGSLHLVGLFLSGCRAIFMFVTGVPGKTKWPVAPASATAMFFAIFNFTVV